ncbi:hypothetical protein QJS10_CPB13g00370 [Acorus calamus]|uniref:Uncharacterized protein n=1 Tax=Acorus calamus TaxID=4465 RepID=A0AAV9DK74_ACOCL|nr:hypothetical protein QJS10_CPB13g00370 [Acorus calamus]
MHIHACTQSDWNDEMVVVVVPLSRLALALSVAMESEEKWKMRHLDLGGGGNLSITFSGFASGSPIRLLPSMNQRSKTGGRLIITSSRPPVLHMSDHVLMKCQKEEPSPTTWLKEKPKKTPSTSSVSCTERRGRVWPSWLTARSWGNSDLTRSVGT